MNYSLEHLCKIDLETCERYTMCSHKKFHWKSQMVCHNGFLYAISKKGELCKINLQDEQVVVISSGWSTSKWGSTALTSIAGNPIIYAIAEGTSHNSFYTIDPSEIGTKNELKSGCYFTTMQMTGHGTHLYTVDDRKIYAYNTKYGLGSYKTIVTGKEYKKWFGDNKSVHLMSHGLTLYLQVNTEGQNTELYLIKPHWLKLN